MKNIILFTLLSLSIFVLGCKSSKTSLCQEKPKDDCICTFEYNPVCGCNDVTYGNACSAECNGITDYVPGACEK